MNRCFWAPNLSLVKRPYQDEPKFCPCQSEHEILDVFGKYGIPYDPTTRHHTTPAWATGEQRKLSRAEMKLIKQGVAPKVELGLDHESIPSLRFSRGVVKEEIIGALCCSVEKVFPGDFDPHNLDSVVRQCLRTTVPNNGCTYEFRPDKGSNVLVFIRSNDLSLASDTVKLCIYVIDKLPYLAVVATEDWPAGTMLLSRWGEAVTSRLLTTLVWIQAGHSHNAMIYEQILRELGGRESNENESIDQVDIGEHKWLRYLSDPVGLLSMHRQLSICAHKPKIGFAEPLSIDDIATLLIDDEEAYKLTNCTKIDRTLVPNEIRKLIREIVEEKPSWKHQFGKYPTLFNQLLRQGHDSPVTELRRIEWIHHPVAWVNVPDRPQYAVYATQNLRPGEPILVYKGALVRSQGDFDPQGTYAFDLGYGISVDASKFGNQARFVNDDWERPEEGNAEYSVVWDDAEDVPVLVISARRGKGGIRAGTEIVACYGTNYWAPRLKKLAGYQAQFYVATMRRIVKLQNTLRLKVGKFPARPSWNQLLLRREGHFFAPTEKRPPRLSRGVDERHGDPEMEVERLIDKKEEKGTIFYLVRWKKYDASHDSWEPAESISADTLIQEYEQSAKK